MIGAAMLVLLATVTPGGWGQIPAGGVPDSGPCASAARSGESFALACRNGVWLGTTGGLDLALSCRSSEEHPNRVRMLDEERFLASTPCGLFLVAAGGRTRRLAGIPVPGCLDTDGAGRAVVAGRNAVWLVTSGGGRRRLAGTVRPAQGDDTADGADDAGGQIAGAQPVRIEIGGGRLLVAGRDGQRLLRIGARSYAMLAGDAHHALLADGRLMALDRRGRVEVRGGTSSVDPGSTRRFSLGLQGVERVEAVAGCGAGVFVASDRRWFWLSGRQVLARGGLPATDQLPVPVRAPATARVPWLLADGILYRPVRTTGPRRRGRIPGVEALLAAARRTLGMPALPAGGGWSGLWPRLEIRAAGSLAAGDRSLGDAARAFHRGATWTVCIRLVWSLDRLGRPPAAAARERLRVALRRQRRRLRARLVRLLAATRAGHGPADRGEPGPVRARLDLLTGGAFSAGVRRAPGHR